MDGCDHLFVQILITVNIIPSNLKLQLPGKSRNNYYELPNVSAKSMDGILRVNILRSPYPKTEVLHWTLAAKTWYKKIQLNLFAFSIVSQVSDRRYFHTTTPLLG